MRSMDEYRALIERLESESRDQPGRYKLKLFLLAILGMGYLALMLVIALACSVGLVLVGVFSKNPLLIKALFKLAFIPLALSYVILKAMWLRFDEPEGYPLEESEAPRLFAEIGRLRKPLNAQKIHRVLITPDFNAAMASVPRLGVLGMPRNYLILGLPLMNVLSADELRAVISHELGHLANNHARFGHWIYRIRNIWTILLERLEQENSAVSKVFSVFFNWYAPFFNAYSFVLARADEFEADTEAARLTSRHIAAAALTKTAAYADYMSDTYWSDLYSKTRNEQHPPTDPYSRLIESASHMPKSLFGEKIKEALQRETDLHDTHPCLRDRLRALGTKPDKLTLLANRDSAAAHWLGDLNAALIEDFNAEWLNTMQAPWSQRYDELQICRAKIQSYQKSSLDGLDEESMWDYATALEEYEDGASAFPVYRALLERNPEHPYANFIVGRDLLYRQDETGVELLNKAIELDSDLDESANELLFNYYHHARQDEEQADIYYQRWIRHAQIRQAADEERAKLDKKAVLHAHELDDDSMLAVVDCLRETGRVKHAWLARREVEHLPEIPAFLLAVELKGFRLSNETAVSQVAQAIGEIFPAATIHVFAASDNRALAKKLKKTDYSEVFP